MKIVDYLLKDGEYYKDVVKKNTIVIHHTAGSHRPDFSIDGWAHDKSKDGGQLAVATAYVIGGISTTDGSAAYDGAIYRAFDDKYWAHHLGCKTVNNKLLNEQSVAIEVCNYGPLTKSANGVYLNYVNKPVPESMVAQLDKPFKGFTHYHKYTDKQILSLHELIIDISKRHLIDITKGLKPLMPLGAAMFCLNSNALAGSPGVWTHVNYREDKQDMWPQPELIAMLKSL
jgi:hypothetical protein